MTDNQIIDEFSMAGTEATGEYSVVVITSLGSVGVRDLSDGSFRVRVEPSDQAAAKRLAPSFSRPGWKQQGDNGQTRFSTVGGRQWYHQQCQR